jgi:cystathionine beta-lyase
MAPDVTPLWLADMAFRTPLPIRQALEERIEHGIIGYSVPTEDYYDSLGGWFERRHGWVVDPRGAVQTRGVVHALHLALESLTSPGAGVIIQPPVYQPFFEAVQLTGRRLLACPLLEADGAWEIDFDQFEAAARRAEAFILCSPHNPIGRVWRRDELERLAEICLRHGVMIISDEIHMDFVYPGAAHTVTASLAPEVADITLTCTAPSKTFNLAGLQLANIFAANSTWRQRLIKQYALQGLSQHPALSLVACQAAYSGANDAWVDQLVAYLDGNLNLISQMVSNQMPGVSLVRHGGTYFAWLDFRQLLANKTGQTTLEAQPRPDGPVPAWRTKLDQQVLGEAKLWLSDGASYGAEGAGFKRLNAAAPRPVIADAMRRLAAAVQAKSA